MIFAGGVVRVNEHILDYDVVHGMAIQVVSLMLSPTNCTYKLFIWVHTGIDVSFK